MWDGDDLSEDDEEESSEEESEGEGSGELGEEEEEDESNLSETEDAKEKCVSEGSSDEEEKDEDDESDDEINNKSYLPYRDKEEIKEEKEGQKKSAHQFTVYQKTNVSHGFRNAIILDLCSNFLTRLNFPYVNRHCSAFFNYDSKVKYFSYLKMISRRKCVQTKRRSD